MKKTDLVALLLVCSALFTACAKEDTAPANGGNGNASTLSERDQVIADYNANFPEGPFDVFPVGWTGSAVDCDPGQLPSSTLDAVLARINYYRRLVGLNDNTTWDTATSDKFQRTALIMHARGGLSHDPPDTWECWTALGHEGAGQANLAMASGTNAIDAFMLEYGALNVDVGHRRWILHSAKTKFGYGGTSNSTALGTQGAFGGNQQIPEFIAYPPEGFMPRPLVFPRWHFAIPNADFSNAEVTMTGPNGEIPVTVVARNGSYGDKAIVWEQPQGGVVTGFGPDMDYTVTITGVTNAPQNSYTYTVTLVDP